MKLNRWTILGIILLLSTVVGLLFRPWGDGFEGQQVVEHRAVILTCPQSVTAALGEKQQVLCEFTVADENPEDYRLDAYGDMEQVSPGRYTLMQEFSVKSSEPYEVKVNREVTEKAVLRMRDNVTGPALRRLASHPVAVIDVRVRQHPIFYAGFVLTLLLTVILVGGPLAALLALALRRFRSQAPFLVRVNHALNETPLSDWLVRPWLFAVSIRAITNARPQTMLRAYMALDTLWKLYFLLAVLIIPYRLLHIFHSQRQPWPAAGVELTVAIFMSIIIIIVLVAIRQLTFFSVVSPYWGPINMENVEQERPRQWANSAPFVFAAIVGFFGIFRAATYYWGIWL